MNSDHEHDDPLVDSCLEEVLGNRAPPDLSSRILAAWRFGTRSTVQRGNRAVHQSRGWGWAVASVLAIAALLLVGILVLPAPRKSLQVESRPAEMAQAGKDAPAAPAQDVSLPLPETRTTPEPKKT